MSKPLRICLLLGFLVLVFLANLSLGSVAIPFSETVAILTGGASEEYLRTIVLELRLPTAITAILAGASLAVAGLLMQALFRNPLAGPYVLGINSGASLGVALVMLAVGSSGAALLSNDSFLSGLSVVAAASIGSACVLVLILFLAAKVDALTLLLVGLMIGYMTGALSNVLIYLSIPERVQAYLSWTYGHFGNVDWYDMRILLGGVFLGLLLAFINIKSLNALMLGEAYAESVGVNIKRARILLLSASALLAGVVSAYCGPIGFIGVAVPHICRGLLKTSDYRVLLPACLLVGALVALVADLIARVPGSELQLPLNSITALIGAPVIITILLRGKHYRRTFGG